MKLRSLLAALALCLLASTASASPAPGKPQSLTTPDQVPDGLAKSDWQSIRAAYEAGRHSFQPTATGWQARNPGQQWTTQFDKRGFLATPRDGGWTWGLELQSYGFPGAERAIHGVPAVQADGQRLTYQWDAAVQEWWVNDKRGLEHGFTVKERPAGSGQRTADSGQPTTLNFLLATRGSLTPAITDDAKGVLFRDAAGVTVLNYTGLKVWDADGKVLTSRFELAAVQLSTLNSQPTVRLLVDERDARYPLTIDPIAQQAYLKSGNNGGPTTDRFGTSVAVSGDTVVVGANLEDSITTGVNSTPDENASGAGAAYVFVRSGTTWTQQAYLKAHQVTTFDNFGISVAVSGDTVVVGASFEDSSTTGVNSTPDESADGAGAAYVFVRSGTTWTQQAYLKASQVSVNDQFGGSVAVSGDTVIVGAISEDSSTTGVDSTPDELASTAGAAYVFVRSGTTWTQQAYLKASNAGANDQFGVSVAVAGDTVVVGANQEDSSTTGVDSTPNEGASNAGAAYVFVRSGTTWSQQAYLKASNAGTSDQFGLSVAVSGNTVVVGAFGEDSSTTGVNSTPNESASNAGAAYVFVRSAGVWSQQAYLKPAAVAISQAADNFGTSVAVAGDTVVVGAAGEDSKTTGVNSTPDELASGAGAAYVFVRSGTTWTQQAYLKASNAEANDQFGGSVAVSGDTVVVGAIQEDSSTTGVNSTPNELASNSGAAYVFVRSSTTWTQQAYVKASNTPQGPGAGDIFGNSVAVAGDTVVVGAPGEDSSTTGVNSTPDELASGAGAAYVFVRSGTTWTQQAYLKASEVSLDDRFGTSVAVAGDTVVVGANLEDSSTTGVNSTPNQSADGAGAAYVFVRSGTTWTQQAYLKAGQVSGGDQFGISVAVAGDTVVVGALGESSSTTGVNSTPNESASLAGAAFVFVRSGTTWTQQAYLKASQVTALDNFGTSVAVSGDTVVVGASSEDSSTTGVNSTPLLVAADAGAAYVFVRSGTMWTQQAYLKASQVTAGDQFGISVAVSGDTVVVGAHQEGSSTTGVNSTPDELAAASGAAYVFVRSGTTWTQQAYFKASQVSLGDQFGTSVAVSGDTVVVGAIQEDSSTTGVNSTPNELASNSGAAYVFVRSGTTWTQQAYLKAHQVTTFDNFGASVAVSGDTVVVGATGEDSSKTGVNSTPDEGASGSGAAYIFTGFGAGTPAPAAPTITSVTPPANGNYRIGQYLIFTVNFSAAVTVTGTPQLPVVVGTTTRAATYFFGSGSTGLMFTYAVQAGDLDGDGVVTVSPLVLSGGTIKAGSTDATLTFTPPNTSGVLVDTAAPTITISAPSASSTSTGPITYTVTYADAGFSASTLAVGHITLNKTGNADGTVAVTGSGTTRTVTISGITGTGTLGITIAAGTASDVAGNTAPASSASGTFTVAPAPAPRGGAVFAWGFGASGRLGNNAETSSSVPVAVDTSGVLNGKTITSVAAGNAHAVALTSDGLAYAWGNGVNGQLGNNAVTGSLVPVAVDTSGVLAGKSITAINAGGGHSLAVASDGRAYAWGFGGAGRLGNNATTDSSVPVAVDTTGVLAGKTVTDVAAGTSHSLALTSDGRVYAWGNGTVGQLGNNATTDSSVPVAVNTTGVLAGKTVTAIAAGQFFSLALTSDGGVYAWGSGLAGRLGNNATTNSSVPVAVDTTGVLNGKTVTAIAAGDAHALALTSDGRVYAWGSGTSGRLGNNATTGSSVPVAVDITGVLNGKTLTAVGAGDTTESFR